MASNPKLTRVIRGRTIAHIETDDATARVIFDDGSVMAVHLAGSSAPSGTIGRVIKVRQSGCRLQLDLDGGRTLEFVTAEPTASVLLRARDGTLQYAD